MKTKFNIGADISKDKINFCLFINEKFQLEREVPNETEDLKKFIKEVNGLTKSFEKAKSEVEVIFACEFTGIYNNLLLAALVDAEINTYVIHAPNIRVSMGINREKNDIVDARMIAEYAFRFGDKLNLWTPDDDSVIELKTLETQRTQFVKMKQQMTQANEEQKKFMKVSISASIIQIKNPVEEALETAIREIELRMKKLIKDNVELKKSYDILKSVPGIGPVIARSIICITNNFQKINDAKKFGCYCGIVPFSKSSGKKIGKQRVSKIANMQLKKLIHMGALAVIRSEENNFGRYYLRKVMEGKNHMLVINNVRNKIITVAFGCISKGEKYRADYEYMAS